MASKTLLIVAHANIKKLAQAAYDGTNHADVSVEVVSKPSIQKLML